MLGPKQAAGVVQFYALFEAMRTEAIILARGDHDDDPVKAAKAIERALALWEQIEPSAQPLIDDLFGLSGEQPG